MGYPRQTGARPAPNRVAQDERAAALVGDRGRQSDALKAVTRGDAAGAGAVNLKATFVSAAPTAAEHNALVADVRALAAVLARMGATITGL
jgi:hypothetical protein